MAPASTSPWTSTSSTASCPRMACAADHGSLVGRVGWSFEPLCAGAGEEVGHVYPAENARNLHHGIVTIGGGGAVQAAGRIIQPQCGRAAIEDRSDECTDAQVPLRVDGDPFVRHEFTGHGGEARR